MFVGRKRLTLLWFFIALIIIVVGCSSANTTSLGEENKSTLVEPPARQEKEEVKAEQENVIQEINQTNETESLEEQSSETQPTAKEQPEQKPPAEKVSVEDKKDQAETAQTNVASSKVEEKDQPTVSLAIVGPQGEDHIILEKTVIDWQDGDTVLEVLKRVTRLEKIHLEYRGRSKNAYIEGIDNLYEFDRGPLSGWVYRVNGVFPSNSAGAYSVEKGDFIEWLYTLDLGQDVGGQMQGAQGK